MMDQRIEFAFNASDVVRSVLAIALAGSLPFVLYFADVKTPALRTYADAVAAVIAFYFAARTGEAGAANEVEALQQLAP
jgi:hypothetical protein